MESNLPNFILMIYLIDVGRFDSNDRFNVYSTPRKIRPMSLFVEFIVVFIVAFMNSTMNTTMNSTLDTLNTTDTLLQGPPVVVALLIEIR